MLVLNEHQFFYANILKSFYLPKYVTNSIISCVKFLIQAPSRYTHTNNKILKATFSSHMTKLGIKENLRFLHLQLNNIEKNGIRKHII